MSHIRCSKRRDRYISSEKADTPMISAYGETKCLVVLQVLAHVHSIRDVCAPYAQLLETFLSAVSAGLALAPSGAAHVCTGIRGATASTPSQFPLTTHDGFWNDPSC